MGFAIIEIYYGLLCLRRRRSGEQKAGQALKARYGRILFRDGGLLRGGAAAGLLLAGGCGDQRHPGGVYAVCDEPEPPGKTAAALYSVHVHTGSP